MNAFEQIIFKDKKFSSLIEEIYQNQKKKEKQIAGLITELKPLVKEIGDATLIVPLIKDYLEIGVKNDDQLVKLATIIQRITQTAGGGNGDYEITDEEKAQILKNIDDLNEKK